MSQTRINSLEFLRVSSSPNQCPQCNSLKLEVEKEHIKTKQKITSATPIWNISIERNEEGLPGKMNYGYRVKYLDSTCGDCGFCFTNWFRADDGYVGFVERTPF